MLREKSAIVAVITHYFSLKGAYSVSLAILHASMCPWLSFR